MGISLITGANGFIGRNLVYKLLRDKMEVFAIVSPKHNVFYNFRDQKLHVYCIDLNDILDYISEFPTDTIDIMYHLAWNGVSPEFRNDLNIQMSNINLSLKCMKFASMIGIRRIIFPGSSSEYLYYGKPLNKNAIPSPHNTYGAIKIALRYLCNDFAVQNHMEFIYTIITGIYAADRKDNNIIFYTINKLLHREKPSFTKLEQKWDYVYIDDVIKALLAIGEKGKDGAVYAIGHGDNWMLSNYIKIIHKKIDASLPLGIGDIAYINDKIPCSCIDLTDLEKDTGFVPEIDFETGITWVIDKIKLGMEENGSVK